MMILLYSFSLLAGADDSCLCAGDDDERNERPNRAREAGRRISRIFFPPAPGRCREKNPQKMGGGLRDFGIVLSFFLT
jgi:hypothetical protein